MLSTALKVLCAKSASLGGRSHPFRLLNFLGHEMKFLFGTSSGALLHKEVSSDFLWSLKRQDGLPLRSRPTAGQRPNEEVLDKSSACQRQDVERVRTPAHGQARRHTGGHGDQAELLPAAEGRQQEHVQAR